MKTKIKTALIGLTACLVLALLGIVNTAKADYWTRYTRASSNDKLPQYFELENMAKSTLGVRFFYGTDRKTMAGAGTDTHNLISFDGTNWTDQTSAVESVAGYNDIEFKSMYADRDGNVWLPNKRDPDRPLLKFNGATGSFEKISATAMSLQAGAADLKVNNLFTGPNNLIYAVATSSAGRLYIIYYENGTWHNSDINGDPFTTYGSDQDIFGLYSSANGGSFWIYRYGSSENEYSNPNGGDQGAGIWKYQNSTWNHYDSTLITSDGATFVNGVTEAFADSTGKVWVGSRHGVFMYDGVNWVNWTKDNNNIFTNRVIKIQEDSNGRIWIICLENENLTDDKGGISIYTPSDSSWDYYTSYNGEDAIDNATNIFMIGSGSEAWMFTGHGEQAMSAGIYALTRDSAHTAIYGQTSGTIVAKADFSQFKKKKKTSSNKAVTIYKLRKVKKKWKKSVRVYKGSASQWYKALNLDTGRYLIEYKAKGKKKKSRTVTVTSGDPYRLNLK